MKYDVIVIGAGLSGLTAASLLAKRGLRVAVVDRAKHPGGSCGVFKRSNVMFDQGSAMLFGFGDEGFNAHRFVFNCLEEPFAAIKHELLYCVNFLGHRIRFWPDIDKFVEELGVVFPTERRAIQRFYRDLEAMYRHVIAEVPSYTTPDETNFREALPNLLRHPLSYLRFLGYLNKSARNLLARYFSQPEIFQFFDKLTSTYCYTTVEESPAVLAAVMFVDNHAGGSYYPAGSTLFLPGKLEKVIEEHGGHMISQREVTSLLFRNDHLTGVVLDDGGHLSAQDLIYSGTVWNLYEKLIPPAQRSAERGRWAKAQVPTYPSVVLYAYVDRQVIPADTAAVEMLVGDPAAIAESEVTAYIFSIDDRTLCPDDGHVVVAIGPSFRDWEPRGTDAYRRQKSDEVQRLLTVLERRFPGFSAGLRWVELATPATIERYTMKNGGAVAGPKQMLGQHMLKRLKTRTEWDNLFCCGESTVMGTGTPTVTISGVAAANAVLRKRGLEPFVHDRNRKNYVKIEDRPFTEVQLYAGCSEQVKSIKMAAACCQYCDDPACSENIDLDVSGLMRRVTVGNLAGAKRLAEAFLANHPERMELLPAAETRCILAKKGMVPVAISSVVERLLAHELPL